MYVKDFVKFMSLYSGKYIEGVLQQQQSLLSNIHKQNDKNLQIYSNS